MPVWTLALSVLVGFVVVLVTMAVNGVVVAFLLRWFQGGGGDKSGFTGFASCCAYVWRLIGMRCCGWGFRPLGFLSSRWLGYSMVEMRLGGRSAQVEAGCCCPRIRRG